MATHIPNKGSVTTSIVLTFVGVFLSTSVALAQNAQLSGLVRDQQGAVIVGADVTITNDGTQLSRSTATDNRGLYVLASLQPGPYHLKAAARGFRDKTIDGVLLEVNQDARLDIALAIGAVSESVSVRADSSMLSNRDASIGLVIDRTIVERTPLPGRTFHALLELAPGVVYMSSSPSGPGFSVNGQRRDSNYFTIDGVSANVSITSGRDLSGTGAAPATTLMGGFNGLISLDSLQELRVQTSAFAPEYGRTPGGQVSMVTRSGTNALRGTAALQYRPEGLQAQDWYTNYTGGPAAEFRQTGYAATLGGPVLRSRLFYFGSFESLRLNQPRVIVGNVPSMELRASAPVSIRPLLNALPLPNGPERGPGFSEYTTTSNDPTRQTAFSVRGDGQLTPNLVTFARYAYSPSTRDTATGLGNVVHMERGLHTGTAGLNWTPSTRLIGEIRFNVSRSNAFQLTGPSAKDGATPPPSSIWPSWLSSGYTAYSLPGGGSTQTGSAVDNSLLQVNTTASLSGVYGAHQPKLGLDVRMLKGTLTASPFLLADFGSSDAVMASVATFVLAVQSRSSAGRSYNASLYGQDSWRMTSRLTTTYGLRWDVNPAPTPVGAPPLTITGLNDPTTTDLRPSPGPLWKTRYGNIAPRLGLSYALNDQATTVLSAGVGLFYDIGSQSSGGLFGAELYPFTQELFISDVPFPIQSLPGWPPPATLTGTPPYSGNIFVVDPELPSPSTRQWSVKLEQQIGGDQMASIAYVGNRGRQLLSTRLYPRPNDNFTASVKVAEAHAASEYDALLLQYRRRATGRAHMTMSYTFAKAYDNVSSGGLSVMEGSRNSDWGPSDADLRHNLTTALSLDLPAPRGALRPLLAGWGLDLLARLRSAFPLTLLTGVDAFGLGNSDLQRPNIVPGQAIWLEDPSVPSGQRLNRAAFARPGLGAQGDLKRNSIRALPAKQVDLALRRNFRLSRTELEFRLDAYNVFNWPQHGLFATRMDSGTSFGLSRASLNGGADSSGTGESLSRQFSAGGPRTCDVSLRWRF